MKKIFLLAILSITALATATPITLEFQEFVEGGFKLELNVTIDEISRDNGGVIDTYLEITADISKDQYGDILALYVDFDLVELPSGLTTDRFSVLMYDNNIDNWITVNSPYVELGNNDVSLQGAAGMKGGLSSLFDAGAAVNDNGLVQDIDPATLLIKTTGLPLSLGDIARIGIRAGSAGIDVDSREGSLKIVYSATGTPVPEPAVLTLLGTGLLALALFKRKKN